MHYAAVHTGDSAVCGYCTYCNLLTSLRHELGDQLQDSVQLGSERRCTWKCYIEEPGVRPCKLPSRAAHAAVHLPPPSLCNAHRAKDSADVTRQRDTPLSWAKRVVPWARADAPASHIFCATCTAMPICCMCQRLLAAPSRDCECQLGSLARDSIPRALEWHKTHRRTSAPLLLQNKPTAKQGNREGCIG